MLSKKACDMGCTLITYKCYNIYQEIKLLSHLSKKIFNIYRGAQKISTLGNAGSAAENFQSFIKHNLKAKVWSFFWALIYLFMMGRSWDMKKSSLPAKLAFIPCTHNFSTIYSKIVAFIQHFDAIMLLWHFTPIC